MFPCVIQVGQYIGEICRYLLAQPPKPVDKQHKGLIINSCIGLVLFILCFVYVNPDTRSNVAGGALRATICTKQTASFM